MDVVCMLVEPWARRAPKPFDANRGVDGWMVGYRGLEPFNKVSIEFITARILPPRGGFLVAWPDLIKQNSLQADIVRTVAFD